MSEHELTEMYFNNLGLVDFVAKKYVRSVPAQYVEDLYAEGRVGLLMACKRFDESKGLKFSTYAVLAIKGRCSNFFYRFIKHKGIDNEVSYNVTINAGSEDKSVTYEDLHGYEVDFDGAVILQELKKNDLLRMYYFEGMKQADIAKKVGYSQVNVSRLIRKEIEELREKLSA